MAKQPKTSLGQSEEVLRLALPSDGAMHEPTMEFFRACGMPVSRVSSRRYTAFVSGLPGVTVLFQRAADIPAKVEEGSADMGVAGLDRFREYVGDDSQAFVLLEDLGYSRCELVVAVPDGWVDVTAVSDLADLSVTFRETGRKFRVATKYPRSTERFLYRHGVNYFVLVAASGTLEAGPLMGYADMITDIVSSGTTLRENRLKTLDDGSILSSQACLIGNRRVLDSHSTHLEKTKSVLERIEAYLNTETMDRG